MQLHRLLALVLIGCLPCIAGAEAETAQQLQSAIDRITASVEAATGCDVVLLGKPDFDESSGKWLVAYSASGKDCDEAAKSLLREGAEVHILFYRKPNLSQVRALSAGMIRTVESGFVCRITMRVTPRFIERSKEWQVPLWATGYDCDAALQELYRRGESLQISFQRVRIFDRQELPSGDIPLLP